jgi:hypothetical protein
MTLMTSYPMVPVGVIAMISRTAICLNAFPLEK